MVFLDLFKYLEEKKVRYLLCGGLAVSIYGIPRSTADIDLILDFETENIQKFSEIMESMKYKPAVPVEIPKLVNEEYRRNLKYDKNMIAISFVNQITNVAHVDIMVNIPFSFEEFWSGKVERKFNDIIIQLISADDLIKMKSISNRIQDEQDIINLLKLKKNG